MPIRRTPLAFLAGLLALLLWASLSPAQVVREAGPLVWPIARRELDRYALILSLDPEQKRSLVELYRGYRSALRQAIEAGDKAYSAAEKTPADPANPGAGSAAEFAAVNGFVKTAHELEASFFEDARALLKPSQADAMPRVERARRREAGLRFSFASGERLDPTLIVEQLKISPEGRVAEVLDVYEVEVDRFMASKAELFSRMFKTVRDLKAKNEEPSIEMISKIFQELGEHSFKVQEVNRRAARQVSELIPEARRAEFEDAVLHASFPTVYSGSPFEKSLAAAEKLRDLSAEQRAELSSLREQYAREVKPINARWTAGIEATQKKIVDKGLEAMMAMDAESQTDPIMVARRERVELAKRCSERLAAILGEDQRARAAKAVPEGARDPAAGADSKRDVFPDFDRSQNDYNKELDEGEEP